MIKKNQKIFLSTLKASGVKVLTGGFDLALSSSSDEDKSSVNDSSIALISSRKSIDANKSRNKSLHDKSIHNKSQTRLSRSSRRSKHSPSRHSGLGDEYEEDDFEVEGSGNDEMHNKTGISSKKPTSTSKSQISKSRRQSEAVSKISHGAAKSERSRRSIRDNRSQKGNTIHPLQVINLFR